MSMRSVDMQSIIFRMHEIERTQFLHQQQPKVVNEQAMQYFTGYIENVKRQVNTNLRAEGTKIREEEKRKQEEGQRRRRSPSYRNRKDETQGGDEQGQFPAGYKKVDVHA